MNPYAKFLGDRDPLHTIESTAGELQRLIDTLGPERTNKAPAPGKWSPREVVCHLADCELVFAFRLRQTMTEDSPTIQPFDQDRWAASYKSYRMEQALAVFSAVRQWNIAMVRSVAPETWNRKVTHPERGEMTFRTLVETMGGHDRNHLAQLESIAGRGAGA